MIASAVPATGADTENPEQIGQEMAKAWRAFERGMFAWAAIHSYEAVESYAARGNQAKQSDALLFAAKAYEALGQYPKATQLLLSAHKTATRLGDKKRIAAVTGSLGKIYLLTGSLGQARRHLERSVALARGAENLPLQAANLNNLGKLLSGQGRIREARISYRKSAELAVGSGERLPRLQLERAKALVGLAKLALQDRNHRQAGVLLAAALTQIRQLPVSQEKAFGFITAARLLQRLYNAVPASITAEIKTPWASSAYHALVEAAAIGERLDDMRTVSYARGYLAQIYVRQQRPGEALQLTRQAVFAAQQTNAPEILYRWQWQAARMLSARGQLDAALAAYRRAVYSLRSVHQDLSIEQALAHFSFRQTSGPLFVELADLLLRRASSTQNPRRVEQNLLEARDTVEQLKAVELQDYFRDDCVADLQARTTDLDRLSSRTIAVYPILLANRTELLLSLPEGMRQVTVAVGRDRLTREVRLFRSLLEKRTTREYLPHAQQLYRWLIAPIEAALDKRDIGTLVFVPDGPLRTVPMAALHDGKQFLVEKYALAITPGLTLTDPQSIERGDAQVLVAGLTEPVQGFPALEHVTSELRSIEKLFPSTALKNEQFLISNVQQRLTEAPYSIVHIASHGQFVGDANQSFLLTFDGRLTMDRLEQLMSLGRYRTDPVELLTLSACQTAAGDDRAALGLAGVAVKAGARSALASLWLVNDQAASLLVSEFYRRLQRPGTSKAEAQRQAQVWLQSDNRYEHPGYWSAFLMIGNWL